MDKKVKDLTDIIAALAGKIGRPVRLMEVCGTHTVAIFRHGIRNVLPGSVSLLSGPGCPVCVTSVRDIDIAVDMARTPEIVLATFGDMMRVPGSGGSLENARAEGADVRVVYSPLDALELAKSETHKKVVFFAAGFETTSPLVAATLIQAELKGVGNFLIHPVHKLVPPALRALLDSGDSSIDGLILPGHVSAIIGSSPYEFLARDYNVPSVITGFGAVDILQGILMLMGQIHAGRPQVDIQYRTVVRPEGNPHAMETLRGCFREAEASYWRGIGEIPYSGLVLKEKYSHRDAARAFGLDVLVDKPEPTGCRCGEVLKGLKLPPDCPLFGGGCTPESPVGACMVSTEGSCSAYYKYGGGPPA